MQKEYTDFTKDYIQSIATEKGWAYSEVSSGEHDDSLYNNPKTSSKKINSLSFEIDGYKCEYYTSEYWSLDYASQFNQTKESYEKSGGDANKFVRQAQTFAITLPFEVEPLYVESKTNLTFSNILGLASVVFKDSTKVELEGDFKNFFNVYTPKDTELNAFVILAPNTMIRILRDAGNFDIEFSGNKVFFYQTLGVFTPTKILLRKKAYDDLLSFGVESAKYFVRAGRPAESQTSTARMWQLYGQNMGRLLLSLVAVFGVTLIVFVSFVFPPLWPVFLVFVALFFIKYSRLRSKKKKLLRDWNPDTDSLIR